MKEISVVIPAYNQAEFLREAIQSVLDQTYANFEIIVVDDASPDHTSEVVMQFDDPRVNLVAHVENRGLPASRNTGIRAARGELIALLDADDYFHPEKIETHVNYLENHPEIEFPHTELKLFSQKLKEKGISRASQNKLGKLINQVKHLKNYTPGRKCLCHNDLSGNHFRAKILDWSMANISEPVREIVMFLGALTGFDRQRFQDVIILTRREYLNMIQAEVDFNIDHGWDLYEAIWNVRAAVHMTHFGVKGDEIEERVTRALQLLDL